jgi:hypothetical protein
MTTAASPQPYRQVYVTSYNGVVYTKYPIYGSASMGDQYIYIPEIKGNRTASMG